jgi:hypothetical protein
MQIVVGGGVFNRAEGLAEEIGADAWASSPTELVECLGLRAQQRRVGEHRMIGRRKRCRRQPVAV